MKKLDESTMTSLEERIPELAEVAVKQAYCSALVSGMTVLEAVNGQLVESHPDGSFTVIKSLPPPTPVRLGERRVRRP